MGAVSGLSTGATWTVGSGLRFLTVPGQTLRGPPQSIRVPAHHIRPANLARPGNSKIPDFRKIEQNTVKYPLNGHVQLEE